jgi:hypothetical protein
MDRRHADSVAALKQVHLEELQAVRCTAQLRCALLCYHAQCLSCHIPQLPLRILPYSLSLYLQVERWFHYPTSPLPSYPLFRGRARDGVALDQLAGQIKQTSGSIKILEVSCDRGAVEQRRAEQWRGEECVISFKITFD